MTSKTNKGTNGATNKENRLNIEIIICYIIIWLVARYRVNWDKWVGYRVNCVVCNAGEFVKFAIAIRCCLGLWSIWGHGTINQWDGTAPKRGRNYHYYYYYCYTLPPQTQTQIYTRLWEFESAIARNGYFGGVSLCKEWFAFPVGISNGKCKDNIEWRRESYSWIFGSFVSRSFVFGCYCWFVSMKQDDPTKNIVEWSNWVWFQWLNPLG